MDLGKNPNDQTLECWWVEIIPFYGYKIQVSEL